MKHLSPHAVRTHEVLGDVLAERNRQDRKWGAVQDGHFDDRPDVCPTLLSRRAMPGRIALDLEIPTAARAKFICDAARKTGMHWSAILVEEVAEAVEAAAEQDTEHLREELVQVAAVATAWVEALDRRKDNHDG